MTRAAPGVGPTRPRASGVGLSAALWRTAKQFQQDNLTDMAAGLTYYGILSIFPGLLVLVSLLGLMGQSTVNQVRDTITTLAPGQVGKTLGDAINQVQSNAGAASLAAALGLLVALWSASGYVAAFIRAADVIYDVPEGRPAWKTLAVRLGLTIAVVVALVIGAVIVVVTGGVAGEIGRRLGVGSTAVTIWNVVKWPFLLVLVALIFELLYWAAPNARHRFRWISPGGILAVMVWLVVSGLFAVYVANFSSYNKTYGSLAAIIIFLVWMWLSNLAILVGAELDAEVARGRRIAEGHPVDEEPYLDLRDDRKLRKKAADSNGAATSPEAGGPGRQQQ